MHSSSADPKDIEVGLLRDNEKEPLVRHREATSFKDKITGIFRRGPKFEDRTITLSHGSVQLEDTYTPNVVRNQKYHAITFLPVVLWEQFRFFSNFYFLCVALTQFIPVLQVGFLFTYIAPLVFVLSITIAKEAYDDIKRYKRDKELNNEPYEKLTPNGTVRIPSADISVGDMIVMHTDQRVPADMILLQTSDKTGSTFVRTDQLDGETDWKSRRAVSSTQKMASMEEVAITSAKVYAAAPHKEIYKFVGTFEPASPGGGSGPVESLNLEHTMWQNTVVASGTVVGLVIYTGNETRSKMNQTQAVTKTGIVDHELNFLSKLLFIILVLLSFALICMKGFRGRWFIFFFRFFLLFSSIIPISMRVNLDLSKTLYSFLMMRDKKIPETVVRNSMIPEELGRVRYLLSDKTGTLTQNEMVFKKLHIGSTMFSDETKSDVVNYLKESYSERYATASESISRRLPAALKTKLAVLNLALCHNVTPVYDQDILTYQASSPDEVALVKYAESVGYALEERDRTKIVIRNPLGELETFEILNIFPFSSATKRMGIVVRDKQTGQISLQMKGADVVMTGMVGTSDWLEEECGNMAREGLRTLVCARKVISEDDYQKWSAQYEAAKVSVTDRERKVEQVINQLEHGLELLCLTGVEDKLQEGVKTSLEQLRNAGISIWMLTGDKLETATCIAISARLVSRSQSLFTISVKENERQLAEQRLQMFSQRSNCCLVIDGTSLKLLMEDFEEDFLHAATRAPAVVACRCSPTQKAQIVEMIKKHTKKETCAIGDGGNDVSMIQASNVGIGIVGKEGRQASLAADFSITQFSHITRLILWHGRNAYKRSARLSQFIIHRGLIITVIQAIFSAMFYFAAIAIYTGWLLVGYTTVFTMAPVFSLVLDEDVPEEIAFLYPELYRELQKGRALSVRTFLNWQFRSIYQGGVIMLLAIALFEDEFRNVVAITFTALILCELANVALEIHKWHWLMILAEVLTVGVYLLSMVILKTYFDISFIATWAFVWKVAVITGTAMFPVVVMKYAKRKCAPPVYRKLK